MALTSTTTDHAVRLQMASNPRQGVAARADTARSEAATMAAQQRRSALESRRGAEDRSERPPAFEPDPAPKPDRSEPLARTRERPTLRDATDARTAKSDVPRSDAAKSRAARSDAAADGAKAAPAAPRPTKDQVENAEAKAAPAPAEALAAQEAGAAEAVEEEGVEREDEADDEAEPAEGMLSLSDLLLPASASATEPAGVRSHGASSPVLGKAGAAIEGSAEGAYQPAGEATAPPGGPVEGAVPGSSAIPFTDFLSVPAAPAPAPIAAPAAEAAGLSAEVASAPAQGQSQAAPVPLGSVPMTIGLRSLAGSNRFEIRLDPKDLGRIDVHLDIDKAAGTVTAQLVVDSPETLALLQRDIGSLQQSLAQAGFDAGEAGINLSLRSEAGSDGRSGTDQQPRGRSGDGSAPASSPDSKHPRLTLDAMPLRSLRGLAGIDIRI